MPILLLGMEPTRLRERFQLAAEDEYAAQSLLSDLLREPPSPLHRAYQAATTALLARFAWNPYTKVSHCRTAARIFQSAVAEAPENPEIRYLRLAFQLNLPAFLGMSEDLSADRLAILRNLAGTEPVLRKEIVQYLLREKVCNRNELANYL